MGNLHSLWIEAFFPMDLGPSVIRRQKPDLKAEREYPPRGFIRHVQWCDVALCRRGSRSPVVFPHDNGAMIDG
jgi:hypothetical protein